LSVFILQLRVKINYETNTMFSNKMALFALAVTAIAVQDAIAFEKYVPIVKGSKLETGHPRGDTKVLSDLAKAFAANNYKWDKDICAKYGNAYGLDCTGLPPRAGNSAPPPASNPAPSPASNPLPVNRTSTVGSPLTTSPSGAPAPTPATTSAQSPAPTPASSGSSNSTAPTPTITSNQSPAPIRIQPYPKYPKPTATSDQEVLIGGSGTMTCRPCDSLAKPEPYRGHKKKHNKGKAKKDEKYKGYSVMCCVRSRVPVSLRTKPAVPPESPIHTSTPPPTDQPEPTESNSGSGEIDSPAPTPATTETTFVEQ
jgi:hypothetical protein